MLPSMRITARLEEASVRDMLGDLLPVTVVLDEDGGDRWIRIDPARVVDFVVDEGLRVEVGGHLQWKTVGVSLPLTIVSAHLLLRPSVIGDDHGARLVFRPSLEKMDLKNVPDFLDSGIVNIINKRLEGAGDKLSWRFGETLKSTVPVGKDLAEIESFDLSAGEGAVLVENDAIVFTLELSLRFTRTASQNLDAPSKS